MKQLALLLLIVGSASAGLFLQTSSGDAAHIVASLDRSYEKIFNRHYISRAAEFYAFDATLDFVYANETRLHLSGRNDVKLFLLSEYKRGVQAIFINEVHAEFNNNDKNQIRTVANFELVGSHGMERGRQLQVLNQVDNAWEVVFEKSELFN